MNTLCNEDVVRRRLHYETHFSKIAQIQRFYVDHSYDVLVDDW